MEGFITVIIITLFFFILWAINKNSNGEVLRKEVKSNKRSKFDLVQLEVVNNSFYLGVSTMPEFKIKIKNYGEKTIKYVTILTKYINRVGDDVPPPFGFNPENKVTGPISPNSSLTEHFHTNFLMPDFSHVKVEIVSVEFSDGEVWDYSMKD